MAKFTSFQQMATTEYESLKQERRRLIGKGFENLPPANVTLRLWIINDRLRELQNSQGLQNKAVAY